MLFGLNQYEQPEQMEEVIEEQLAEVDLTTIESKKSLLSEMNIDQIHTYLREGKVTCVEITAYYLQRILQLNKEMKALISVNPEAIKEAKRLDEEFDEEGLSDFPLYGIPIIVKDNIETKDPMPTSSGTDALKDHYSDEDSEVIAQIRSAGAIILAKANLSELAGVAFLASGPPPGFSAVGGQTKNPYGQNLNVSGSSSGSAVGLALDFAPIALGTETYGSIIGPASSNSVIGMKPTLGLLSQQGIIPLSHTYDTVGPMGKTVKDTAILLSVMAGYKPDDRSTYRYNYFSELRADGLKGSKIAASTSFQKTKIGQQIIRSLRMQGATVDLIDYSIPENQLKSIFKEVVAYELKVDLNNYLKERSSLLGIRSFDDLIRYNEEDSEDRIPYGQESLLLAQQTDLTPSEHQEKITYLKKVVDEQITIPFFIEKNYDAILTFNARATLTDYGHFPNDISAYAKFPTICLPVGYIDGAPVSITFVGPAYSDKKLLQLAYAFEQNNPKRRSPKLDITN
jgi:amidase